MRAALGGIVAATLAVSIAPAAAGWQYTRWGMTPAEVKAASDGAAQDVADRSLDASGLKAELLAPYQGSVLPFTAVFLFDGKERLETVSLNPVGDLACPVMLQVLGLKYGKPVGDIDMVGTRTMRWDDAEADNLVVYLDLGRGNCTIQYSMLPNTRPNGKGL